MNILTKEILEHALKLESNRRNGPFDERGLPINFDKNDKIYQDWLQRHGYLLITELLKTKT